MMTKIRFLTVTKQLVFPPPPLDSDSQTRHNKLVLPPPPYGMKRARVTVLIRKDDVRPGKSK